MVETGEDDGEFRACLEFIRELTPELLARVDQENQLLLFALSQVREMREHCVVTCTIVKGIGGWGGVVCDTERSALWSTRG